MKDPISNFFPNPRHILDVGGREEENFQIFNTNSTPTLILKTRHNDAFIKVKKKKRFERRHTLSFQVFLFGNPNKESKKGNWAKESEKIPVFF